MKLTWGYASEPRRGESANGDAIVARTDGDATLLAVIDALGHGAGAAEVADVARAWLEAASLGARVEAIVDGLHGALRGSRGAAAMVCVVAGDRLRGCG